MKTGTKIRAAIAGLIITTVVSFAGALSGTVAWFAYVTRAAVSYVGTSVNQAELLQIGLVLDDDEYTARHSAFESLIVSEGLELTHELTGGKHCYFARPGSGLNSNAIQTYLGALGYAKNELEPITSRYYDSGDALTLYRAPNARNSAITIESAKTQYCHVKFAMRIIVSQYSTSESTTYAEDKPIWLSDAVARADGAGNIANALRIHVDGTSSNSIKYILNPSSTRTKAEGEGYTNVAGLLNLDNDDYYDYTMAGSEVLYGDYNTPLANIATTSLTSDTGLVDVNGTGVSAEKTTFFAKHHGTADGINCFDYATPDAFISAISPKKAYYKTFAMVRPEIDSEGNLAGGIPACYTGGSSDGYCGFVNLKIWLEGWDHSVIDQEINHRFNLGLQFQINKL